VNKSDQRPASLLPLKFIMSTFCSAWLRGLPYGPYADGFSPTQHRLGPFEPIRTKVQELAASSGTAHAGGPDNGSDESYQVK
jgi:hypothetical protein